MLTTLNLLYASHAMRSRVQHLENWLNEKYPFFHRDIIFPIVLINEANDSADYNWVREEASVHKKFPEWEKRVPEMPRRLTTAEVDELCIKYVTEWKHVMVDADAKERIKGDEWFHEFRVPASIKLHPHQEAAVAAIVASGVQTLDLAATSTALPMSAYQSGDITTTHQVSGQITGELRGHVVTQVGDHQGRVLMPSQVQVVNDLINVVRIADVMLSDSFLPLGVQAATTELSDALSALAPSTDGQPVATRLRNVLNIGEMVQPAPTQSQLTAWHELAIKLGLNTLEEARSLHESLGALVAHWDSVTK